MSQPTDLITEYARLLNRLEADAAAGRQPPAHLIQRALHIENTAAARLAPDQLDAALGHVTQLRLAEKGQQQKRAAHQEQIGREASIAEALRQNTQGLGPDGSALQSLDELDSTLQGKKFKRRNMAQAKAKHRVTNAKNFAKRFGFKSVKDMVKELDGIAHRYHESAGPGYQQALSRMNKLGMTEEDLAHYQQHRGEIILNNHFEGEVAKHEPETTEHTPSREARDRAGLLKAIAENGEDELLTERDVPEAWRNGEAGDLMADVVAAFDTHMAADSADTILEKEHEHTILADTRSD